MKIPSAFLQAALLSCLALSALSALEASADDPPDASRSGQVLDRPLQVGDSIKLRKTDETSGNGVWLVSRVEDMSVFRELQRRLLAKGAQPGAGKLQIQLAESRRIRLVTDGSRGGLVARDSGHDAVKVEVVEGPERGATGWAIPGQVVRDEAPPAASEPKIDGPGTGPVFLQMANGLTPWLARDRATLNAYLSAEAAHDRATIERLIAEGKVISLPSGSAATSREKLFGARRVVVWVGKHAGDEGWIEERFVREAPQSSIIDKAKAEREVLAAKRQQHRAKSQVDLTPLLSTGGGSVLGGGGMGGSSLCGAPTKTTEGPCRNRVVGGGYCYLHR